MATQAESFDYIVTGAGSAGCAVAARLSEIGPLSRAAAGGRRQGPQSLDPHPDGLLPALRQPARQLDVRERARSATRRAQRCISRAARCWAAPARSTAWCTCAATRPTMTNGASAAAPAGTGTACCRTSRRPNTRSAVPNEFHGVGGPLHVSDQPHRSELADRVVEAAIQAGLPPIDDFNDGRQEGAGYFQSTTGKQPPLEHRHRLSASGTRPRQPCGASERARHAHPDRERPRRRRRLRQRRGVAHRTSATAR